MGGSILSRRFAGSETDMKPSVNTLGQPIGFPLPGWAPPPAPPREPMHGHYCQLELLDLDRHAEALFEADAAGDTPFSV